MARKVTIDVEARFKDNVTGEANSAAKAVEGVGKSADTAGKKIDNMGKKNVKPKLDADSGKLDKKLRDTESKLSKLKSKTTEVVVGAKDKASAKLAKIIDKAKSFTNKTWTGFIKLKDSQALQSLKKITSKAEGLVGKTWSAMVKIKDYATSPLTKIKNMLFSIKSVIAAITAALAVNKFVMQPISLADSYTSAQIGFSTLLGETQGQQMMDDLDAFAKATPFKSSEVIAQTQRMIAMGWEAENIIKDMTTIGDAAAATGKGEQGLQQIVTALAQIKTKGKLSTEELNQLAEAGVAAKKYIAEGLGYGSGDEGIAKMTEDLEDGAIGAEAALQALLSGMKEYEGMMDKTANETVEGLWSQIEDTFEINIFRRWGQGLQDGAKRGLGSVVELLDTADGALEDFGDLVHDVGEEISNWAADKLETAVKTIKQITSSDEFKNASLTGKIKMVWDGVIANPFKEWWGNTVVPWWNGTVIPWLSEKAASLGESIGSALSGGLLALLGIPQSEAFADGVSIGSSFVQGFLEGFDGEAVTQAFLTAINNIWDSLPSWAKVLLGGYGAAKVGGAVSTIASGVSTVANVGTSTALALGVGTKTVAAPFVGASPFATVPVTTATAGTATLGTTLAGLGAIAGGVTAGATAMSGGHDYYEAYQAYKEGDNTTTTAKVASGTTKLGGIGAGAGIGFAIGGPVGALIGAGIGGIAGWWGGEKWAEHIEKDSETKLSIKKTQEAAEDLNETVEEIGPTADEVFSDMQSHFGDMTLSLGEISRLAEQIVWGDEGAEKYEKFATAAKEAEEALASYNTAAENTDKWLWKASLGVKFTEDEQTSIKQSFDDYISSAKSYLENKQYEVNAAVSMLVDVDTEDGKAIIDSLNSSTATVQGWLDTWGEKLSSTVEIALEDGVITLDEQAEITNIQQQIAAIMEKLSTAETEAELELIKLKFGDGNLDLESFDTFMATMKTTLEERVAANDEAFTASVSSLKLQLDSGLITQEEYDKQLQTLMDGYTANIEGLKAEIKDVELEIIGDAYTEELGADAKEKLEKALDESLSQGINPRDWTVEQAKEFLGVDDLSDKAALAIATMLGGVTDQLELIEADGDLLIKIGEVEVEEGTGEKVKESVANQVPDKVDETVNVNVTGQKIIQVMDEVLPEDFNIPETIDEDVIIKLNAAETVQEQVEILASEFGIKESEAETILWKLTGEKDVLNKITVTASDFGIPDSIDKTVTVNITSLPHYVTGEGGSSYGHPTRQFRGGIVGGASSLEAFARGGIAGYSDGGIVRGGSRLIEVAEEGNPEMIIPLSSQRRGRALKLWAQAGNMMGVPGFARGGVVGGASQDEGFRFRTFGGGSSESGRSIQVDIGGITFSINVSGGDKDSIIAAIKEQAGDLADYVIGIIADALSEQFENTPVRGGA